MLTDIHEEKKVSPKIYVACLGSYNNGVYHGAWIDANQDAEAIEDAVADMIATSEDPHAEEWAIHDYEFSGIRIEEWDTFERVADLAAALVKHGPAFAAYCEVVDIAEQTWEGFENAYMGEYDNGTDFAQCWYEDMGTLEDNFLVHYIDWQYVWRDMDGYEGIHKNGTFYVFYTH